MKILMIADALDMGGMETHVETLARGLRELGVEVAAAAFGGRVAERMKKDGFRMLPLPDIRPTAKASPPDIRPTVKNHAANVRGAVKDLLPSPLRLLQARKTVARYLDTERPDVVHAHTRRTAFICASLCKGRKIPLICTAHAKFSTDRLRDKLSVWGDATICVSEDIKEHIFSQPQVAKQKIKVINNGIKMPDLAHLPDLNGQKIVFVSRLDADCSLGAHLLCLIAPSLQRRYPNLQITVVGGGSEYEKIKRAADIVSQKINRELIKMTGAVEYPAEYFENASLFVGVSRAALEAMAHSLPTLLLGDEGYLGLLNDGTLNEAMRTNFTCRNSAGRTDARTSRGARGACFSGDLTQTLFREICRYFDMSEAEKSRLAELAHETVLRHYSAEKMARETLELYGSVLKGFKNEGGISPKSLARRAQKVAPSVFIKRSDILPHPIGCTHAPTNSFGRTHTTPEAIGRGDVQLNPVERGNAPSRSDGRGPCRCAHTIAHRNGNHVSGAIKIALCGYYGRGNFGDEAILSVILGKISRIIPRESCKICVLRSKNPVHIAAALCGCDVFIFGGGSLLQNSTSNASLLYYLAVIGLANRLCKRKIMLANGIGPINGTALIPRGRILRALSQAVNTFDLITARDAESQEMLKGLLPHRKIYRLPDPVFAMANEAKINSRLIKSGADDAFAVYIPCKNSLRNAGTDSDRLARDLLYIEKMQDVRICFAVLNEPEDLRMAQILSGAMGGRRILVSRAPSELAGALYGAKFVISQRYHGALFAAFCGAPVLAVSDDPKMRALCKDLLLCDAVSPKIFADKADLAQKIDVALAHRADFLANINTKIYEKSARASYYLEKIIKRFCFPIDNNEQMFYNVKNDTTMGRNKWQTTKKTSKGTR